jgi:hypothetical protein
MKIILLMIAVMLLMTGADARYSPGLEIAEGENITLDGGFINKFQGAGAYNPLAFGAIPNDGIDDAGAIQDAMDAASNSGGGIVFLPPGRYDLNTSQSELYNSTFLEPRDNVTLLGAGKGVTILRSMDNYRTPYRGNCIIADLSENFTHDWAVREMTIDGNGQNNLIDDDSYVFSDNITKGAAVYSNKCGNVTVDNLNIVNISGFNAVVLHGYGDTGYAHDEPRAVNNHIRNCYFQNMGNDISGNDLVDHSTVYLASAYSSISDCQFVATKAAMYANMAAIELHSKYNSAVRNTIQNYRYGIYAASDAGFSGEVEGVLIEDNYIYACLKGINVWGTAGRFKDIHIIENKIIIDPMAGTVQRFGIQHGADWSVANQFPTDILDVRNNYIEFINTSETTSECYGMYFKYYNNTFITGNTVHNSTYGGIYLYELTTDVGSGIGSVTNNNIRRYATSTASSTQKGISFIIDKACGLYEVSQNSMSVKTGKSPNNTYGVYIGGTGSKNFTIRYNDIKNTLREVYNDGVALNVYSTVLVEAHTSSAPTNLRYSQGSIFWDTDPAGGATPGWVVNATGYPKAMANLAA